MAKVFFTFLLLLHAHSVWSASVTWKDQKFSISIPEGWREVKDFYGIPVTLLGPSVSPKPRAVIQIIPTDATSVKISPADAKVFGEKYAEGRKKWIEEQKGEIYELLPGKFEKDRLSTGFSYRLNKKSYIERTTYINCPKKLYHLKIILNFENRDQLNESENIVRSFACAE